MVQMLQKPRNFLRLSLDGAVELECDLDEDVLERQKDEFHLSRPATVFAETCQTLVECEFRKGSYVNMCCCNDALQAGLAQGR
eukprot:2009817-Pleurochrysis_carterae.AAC.1